MKIIAFTGPGGAGKNTAARAVGTRFHCEQLAFASPLYEMAAAALGLSLDEARFAKNSGSTVLRALLENLGDALRATLGPDCLIDRVVDQLSKLEDGQDTPEIAAITDLRTEEEASWVRSMGGLVIHISRPGNTSPSRHSTNQPIAFDQRDQYLVNDSTVEDLQAHALVITHLWLYGKAACA